VKLTTHQQRLLTGAILTALLATLIFWASAPVQTVAVVFLSIVALTELWAMFWSGRKRLKVLGAALSVPVVMLPGMGFGPSAILLACFWVLAVSYMFGGRKISEMALTDVAIIFAGLVYIPFSLHLLLSMSTLELLYVLAAVFASDTVAFYGGSKWGKRKLCPGISPKKTWMGALCSFGICVIISLVVGIIWGQAIWTAWLVVGACINLGAQVGDLFESALKRELGVKDSGGILPGHGGVLDRIDSLLLAVPVYMAFQWMYPLF
jgi:phosphatidate cytidylyltransferase